MYRPEHPNPQFQRACCKTLNGPWEFSYGTVHGRENVSLNDLTIEVPFCPESELSGINNTDFITDCVYSREVEVEKSDLAGRLVLHFGAVDYKAEVYVNGIEAGRHEGGYTSFEIDVTPFARVGKNRITVVVHDDVTANAPSGKQSKRKESFGCFYTRVTGIWQSVWLERTPKEYVKSVKFYPDTADCSVGIELLTEGRAHTEITVYYDGREVGKASGDEYYRRRYDIKLSEKHLWKIGDGALYDVAITFGDDEVKSYFGLRTAEYKGGRFLLNGESVFQRLVLDQGYYPKGLYTAPTARDFRRDIELAQWLGFNGARLHQRVFEQRYLYECDRMGFMVWGEYASWGVRYSDLSALGRFIGEWTEAVEQNFDHPCIITWCPLNEVWNDLDDRGKSRDIRFVESVYETTKILDPTRPCVDTSGGHHGKRTDLFDFHCYLTDEKMSEVIDALTYKNELAVPALYGAEAQSENALYDGTSPLHASEYGGMAYGKTADGDAQKEIACVQNDEAWGYSAYKSEDDFAEQYTRITERIMNCEKICGMCYTQLYDVEQERNGLYTYDRQRKLSDSATERIRECNSRIAATEKEEVKH